MASSTVAALTASDALTGTSLFYSDGLASAVAADVKVTATQIKTWTSASPTLVTPVLGVATGTSISLGGATIGANALAVTGTSTFSGLLLDPTGASGIGFSGSTVNLTVGTVLKGSLDANAQRYTSNLYLGWTNSTTNPTSAPDVTLSRNAAGILQFGTTAANAAGSWLATSGTIGTAATGTLLLSIVNANINPRVSFFYNSILRGYIEGAQGTGFDVQIMPQGTGSLLLGANNAVKWTVAPAGGLSNTAYTLADQAQVLAITATQPASPTGTQDAVSTTITSAGSASQINTALRITYSAGYTGSSTTINAAFDGAVAGTGSTPIPATGSNVVVGNFGVRGTASATTAGFNSGIVGIASGGNISAGLVGISQVVKNSATNVGVVGSAANTGSSPVQIGGFFGLNQTNISGVSAALIADNGPSTDPIFLARDNGSTIFTIFDGGNITGAGNWQAAQLTSTGHVIAANASQFYWSTRSAFASPSDGVITVSTNAGGAFDRLQFGGTTSSFPAIKRSSALLQIRLADDSANAALETRTVRTDGFTVATLPAAGTAGRRAYVTDALTPTYATTVVGGGAVVTPVFDNGTNWIVD